MAFNIRGKGLQLAVTQLVLPVIGNSGKANASVCPALLLLLLLLQLLLPPTNYQLLTTY